MEISMSIIISVSFELYQDSDIGWKKFQLEYWMEYDNLITQKIAVSMALNGFDRSKQQYKRVWLLIKYRYHLGSKQKSIIEKSF